MPHSIRLLRRAIVLALLPAVLQAQGSLSGQGFGYPTGQMSPGALAAGGAGAESDPNSALNPAAITQNNRYSILLHFEPEYRSTRVGGQDVGATVMRFPSFQATGQFRRATFAFGVTTLLDRSWVNTYSDTIVVGGDPMPSSARTSSEGALSDARAAVGYVVNNKLQVGIAVHGFAGENRTTFDRVFPDSTNVGGLSQSTSFGFAGTAVSAGFVAIPRNGLVFAGSIRSGGELTLEENRTQVGSGRVPLRFGLGVNWLAVPGAAFSARFEQVRWSQMNGLGSAAANARDALELAIGTDVLGPKIGGVNSVVRAGFRTRTLPFTALSNEVSERAFSFGAGIPLARGRAQIDLGAQRASRSAGSADERAWLVSLGFGIRP